MFDTFTLHPLPEAALAALRAAAVADGCPEGMAIVGGLTEVRVWKLQYGARARGGAQQQQRAPAVSTWNGAVWGAGRVW